MSSKDKIKNEILKMWLAKEIRESEFGKLCVEHRPEGAGIALEGQTFGLIGALAAAVHAVNKSSGIEIEEILVMLEMAVNIISETSDDVCQILKNTKVDKADRDPDLNSFDDYLRKYLSEEGEE